ncbi:MAG: hypothetical protein ABIN89_14745 [Chitinophagaceae bacterium]
MNKLLVPTMFLTKNTQRQATLKRKPFYTYIKMSRTRTFIFTVLIFTVCSFVTGCKKKDNDKVLDKELNQLRYSVQPFISIKTALAAGYNKEVTGYRTQMGFHYLNESLLDNKFEISKPELLLYAPYGNDSLKFVGAEYATPITDLNNPPPVPEGFTGKDDVWEINTEFKLWTLHAWVGLDNPHGIFSPHNPKLP